ncbi:thiamine pyrophosphate-dependent dehydrogenase E1 component subunit alpha [Nocardia gamkensis]|uniref:thiamine pyrophosphate-dependent dehydrogenase E1 component subunit alpha n=1 Tax=Nocardia gamkensis TaxID=352869 RepID=UPI0036E00205
MKLKIKGVSSMNSPVEHIEVSELTGDRLVDARRLYEGMIRLRLFEERVATLFKVGKLPGFVHLGIGQESVPIGVIDCLRPEDYITATHRGHGHILAKGADFTGMLAELMGKSTGYCRGKGGSMHIFDLGLGILGANGILGAGQPIAVGAAFAARAKGRDDVVATFFGEGASAQGAVHEAMNLAAVWQAPVLFVAEINGFAELTPYEVHVPIGSLTERAAGYGMNAVSVDGIDVLTVREVAQQCIEEVRRGRPMLLEVRTLRWHGHYEGDPQRYRDSAELQRRTELDPIAHLQVRLLEAGVEASELEELTARVNVELDAAVQAAEDAPLPEPSQVFADVYTNNQEPVRA